jgi:hypothetical protein
MEQYSYEFYIWSDTLYIISFDTAESTVQPSTFLLTLASTVFLGFGAPSRTMAIFMFFPDF